MTATTPDDGKTFFVSTSARTMDVKGTGGWIPLQLSLLIAEDVFFDHHLNFFFFCTEFPTLFNLLAILSDLYVAFVNF